MTNYVFIGDVHSQFSNFSAAVHWVQENVPDYHIIQGGDLFDSRSEESDSLGVYNLVRTLGNRITVLQSNHNLKLFKYLTQLENNMQNLESLMRTVNDFGFNNEEFKNEVVNWISSLPYGVAFKDKEGIEYRACHAYWFSRLPVPSNYEGLYKIFDVPSKAKGQMLYGISRRGEDGKSERILWWESTEHRKYETFVRVSFHYHTVSIDLKNRYMILDGSCGDVNGTLIAYDVNNKKCVGFQSGTRFF